MGSEVEQGEWWLTLNRTEGLGVIGQKLPDAFPSIKPIFDADRHTLKDCGSKA